MHTHPMTTHLPHRHESHGNHPMSFVAFALILTGFATAGLWLVHMASGSGGDAAPYGVAAAIVSSRPIVAVGVVEGRFGMVRAGLE